MVAAPPKGRKPAGVNAASPVPCRAGKLRVKIFRDAPRTEKTRLIIDLDTTLSKNRGRGRESAGKPENPPIAVWHRPIITNMIIH
jgi:hypothetical protein